MPVAAKKRASVRVTPTPGLLVSGRHKGAVAAKKALAPKSQPKVVSGSKLPKTLAQCADLLYKTREDRLKLKREVDALEDLESALKQHLIEQLPKSKSSGIAGKSARVALDKRVMPAVKDWTAVHKYIAKNCAKNPGVFAILGKTLSREAVNEVWESGKAIPGVERFEVTTVSCTKLA